MKSKHTRVLNDESRKEFGVLLLLDWLMRYDLLKTEKEDLQQVIFKLERMVVELKKGFFRSEEQNQELSFKKKELIEAKEAFSQIKKEMEENEKFRINIALAEKDEEGLENVLKFMEEKSILTVCDENFFQPTKKGRELYEQLIGQLESYVAHFDIFAYVDLQEGVFGDPEKDLLEGNKWSDLRVAVAEFKGIDPFRVVFLALVSEEKFFENSDWKFDLSLGTLFDEMESLVQDQVCIDDLGYKDDEGIVSGEDVIRDIVRQGELVSKERLQRNIDTKKFENMEGIPDEKIITENYYF